jgi:glycosyltransferase involved in cell wall biosynthesis
MTYVAVTPVFNEEAHIARTIESMIAQSLRPEQWIIVDDNSTDGTCAVAAAYARRHPWITLVKKDDSPAGKKIGGKVVQAFNYGCRFLETDDYAFIVKLDGDLVLPVDYFACVNEAFRKHPEVGICGGYCVDRTESGDIVEKISSYHVRGAFKSIRKECWRDIGGFRDVLGWDGLDEMEALFKGWKTMILDCPVLHLRPTGKDYATAGLARRRGAAAYRNGNNIFLMIVRALVRLNKKPYLVYSICYIFGYIKAWVKKEPKTVSPELARFINRFHLRRLFKLQR